MLQFRQLSSKGTITMRVLIFLHGQKDIPPECFVVPNAFLRARFISIIVAYVQIDGRRTSRFRHGVVVVCRRLSMVYLVSTAKCPTYKIQREDQKASLLDKKENEF